MLVLATKKTIREALLNLPEKKRVIGFVPTMGALHQGHLELVAKAKENCDTVVVSIFVNPTQFAQGEDYSRYPRVLSRDLALLRELKVDFVFTPTEKEMYATDHKTWVDVDELSNELCGKSRPGHFKGVTTVVIKLLNLVKPNYLYMGEKDYQQVVVLEKMIADLDIPTTIVRCPTVRESDGLAMRSRNKYLSPSARKRAICLYSALQYAQKYYGDGNEDAAELVTNIGHLIDEHSGKIDYIKAVDGKTLEVQEKLYDGCRIVMAVYLDSTRLIDNIELKR